MAERKKKKKTKPKFQLGRFLWKARVISHRKEIRKLTFRAQAGCFRWQHRTCGTGISQGDYRYAIQTGASIDWRCVTCQSMSLSENTPVAESTPVDFTESMFTLHEPLADRAESTPVTESTPIAERTWFTECLQPRSRDLPLH